MNGVGNLDNFPGQPQLPFSFRQKCQATQVQIPVREAQNLVCAKAGVESSKCKSADPRLVRPDGLTLEPTRPNGMLKWPTAMI